MEPDTADLSPLFDWRTAGGRWRELLRVSVTGEPAGQPRGRSFALKVCPARHWFGKDTPRCPRCGQPGKVTSRIHDPGTAGAWKTQVANALLWAARDRGLVLPLEGWLRVDLAIFLARPKELPPALRRAYGGKRSTPTGPLPCARKPDRDNLDKAILDAATACGLIRDDAMVCAGGVAKLYAAAGRPPGALIRLAAWEPTGAPALPLLSPEPTH